MNAGVHVKEEVIEYLKEETEWEDKSFCGVSESPALADLYAGHEVKEELVLGPEGLQPRDIVFTLYAAQALNAEEHPALKDCVVRLERVDHREALLRSRTYSNTIIETDKETYVCDICKKRFTLKTQLMEHVMVHIHQSSEREESMHGVADIAYTEEACVMEEADWAHENATCVKDEPQWEDSVASHGTRLATARAELYAGHLIKDELVLGPERPQPPDVFVLHAMPAVFGSGVSSPAVSCDEEIVLKDCVVRLERIADHRVTVERNISNVTSHVDNILEVEYKQSKNNFGTEKEIYLCDICKKSYTLKTGLLKHIAVHIHMPTSAEGINPDDDILNLSLPEQLVLRECSVRLQRRDEHEGPASHASGRRDSPTSSPSGRAISTNVFQDTTEEKTHECDTCGKTFTHKYSLERHIQLHLAVTKTQIAKKIRFPIQKRHTKKNNGLSCEYCNKQFSYLSILVSHRRMHTGEKPYTCKICKNRFKHVNSLKEHLRIHTGEKPYRCKICGKRFRVSSGLRTHEPIHSVRSKYCCKFCDKGFANMTRLKVHERIHTGEKPYACKICKKRFTQWSGVKLHEKSHTGEKHHFCGPCKKGFTQFAHLALHQRIHSGVKPYSCITCGKKFTRSHHLKQHERIHTGEKPYPCGICKKAFSDSANLTRHKLLHTGNKPHSCEVCKKRFAYKNNLKTHERVHTGEKPHCCGMCGKNFAQMNTLNKHMRTHTNEKPFTCGTCGRAFARRCALRVHARTHTRADSRTEQTRHKTSLAN